MHTHTSSPGDDTAPGNVKAACNEDAACEDAALLHRFIFRRDAGAFTELVRRFGPMVQGVAERSVSHRQDAEDVTQIVFAELARRAGTVTDGRALAGWLQTVTTRTALRVRKRRTKTAPIVTEPARQDDPLRTLSRQADGDALNEELDRLPAAWREPLLLRYFAGCDTAEAAARMGLSEEAFKGRVKRGKNSLRVRLLRRGVSLSAVLLAVRPAIAEPGHWEAVGDAAFDLASDMDPADFLGDVPGAEAAAAVHSTPMFKAALVTTAAAVALLSLSGGTPGPVDSGRPAALFNTAAAQSDAAQSDADEINSPSLTPAAPVTVLTDDTAAAEPPANDPSASVEERKSATAAATPPTDRVPPHSTATKVYEIEPWMAVALVDNLVEWVQAHEQNEFEFSDDGTRLTVRCPADAEDPERFFRGLNLGTQIDQLKDGHGLSQRLLDRTAELETLRRTLGEAHPRVVQAKAVVGALKKMLEDSSSHTLYQWAVDRTRQLESESVAIAEPTEPSAAVVEAEDPESADAGPKEVTLDIEPWMVGGLAELLVDFEWQSDQFAFEFSDDATKLTLTEGQTPFYVQRNSRTVEASPVYELRSRIESLSAGQEIEAEVEELGRAINAQFEALTEMDDQPRPDRVVAAMRMNALQSRSNQLMASPDYKAYLQAHTVLHDTDAIRERTIPNPTMAKDAPTPTTTLPPSAATPPVQPPTVTPPTVMAAEEAPAEEPPVPETSYDIQPWMAGGLMEILVRWSAEAPGRTFEFNEDQSRLTIRGAAMNEPRLQTSGDVGLDAVSKQIRTLKEGRVLVNKLERLVAEQAEAAAHTASPQTALEQLELLARHEYREAEISQIRQTFSYVAAQNAIALFDSATALVQQPTASRELDDAEPFESDPADTP